MYDGNSFTLRETLVGVVLTGASVVDISAVACESIDIDSVPLASGFMFSFWIFPQFFGRWFWKVLGKGDSNFLLEHIGRV